jgi:hypothetical protein
VAVKSAARSAKEATQKAKEVAVKSAARCLKCPSGSIPMYQLATESKAKGKDASRQDLGAGRRGGRMGFGRASIFTSSIAANR